ncbi:MAG TPA: ATP-binding cassette domain-containing protein [Terracidiphilus sp.]|nr:ATP-binding cassette domain-containing protein [Terracidiphilus sp.]
MVELKLDARRGGFHLMVECIFTSEWTVIFGPSGSGKSTLLRLLAGLDEPSHGRMTLDGLVLTDTESRVRVTPGKRQCGMVAQHTALFPHLSAAANVAYGLAAMDRTARERRVDEMLELAGATDLAALRPAELSGGQAQRVALARALAPRPRLLLLDEPFSALDGAASDGLLDRLQAWVRANHVQTVMATHDASDALAIEAEVLLLRDGRQAAMGPANEVLAGERKRLVGRLGGDTQ